MFYWQNYWGSMPVDMSNISKKKLAKLQNNAEFANFFEAYFTLAQNLFEWEGLPDTCDARFLERCLLLFGRAMIAQVDGAYVTLGAAPGAGLNIYGYPIKGFGWGINGFNREFSLYVPGADSSKVLTKASDGRASYEAPEAVVCYDNIDAYPYVSYILSGAQRMSDLIRSCDVAVQNLKCPIFCTVRDQEQVKTIKQALDDRAENALAIIAMKQLDLDQFKTWNIGVVPDTLSAFWEQFRNVEAMLLETLGINANDNTDKRERLLVDEINANNIHTNSNLKKRLHQRELFCERVNDAFGLNISVKIREEVEDDGDDDTGNMASESPTEDAIQRNGD